jgi:hypothetical protein
MAFPSKDIGQELLNVPMGQMIREMAFAIADAQIRLDENSIEVAEMMGGLKTIVDENGIVTFEDSRVYFGNDNITRATALEIHNTTTDASLKKIIYDSILKSFAEDAGTPPNTDEFELGIDETIYKVPLVPRPTTGNVGEASTLYDINVNTNAAPLLGKPFVDKLGAPIFHVGDVVKVPARLSMLELGFAPTFYQFVDTIIEVKISITYTQETSSSVSTTIANTNKSRSFSRGFSFKRGRAKAARGRSKGVNTSQVNSSFASKFNYSVEGSSLMRTKLVPIPPPAILEERIRKTLEEERPAIAPESPPVKKT